MNMFELVDEMIEGSLFTLWRRVMELLFAADEVLLGITRMKTSILPAKNIIIIIYDVIIGLNADGAGAFNE